MLEWPAALRRPSSWELWLSLFVCRISAASSVASAARASSVASATRVSTVASAARTSSVASAAIPRASSAAACASGRLRRSRALHLVQLSLLDLRAQWHHGSTNDNILLRGNRHQ